MHQILHFYEYIYIWYVKLSTAKGDFFLFILIEIGPKINLTFAKWFTNLWLEMLTFSLQQKRSDFICQYGGKIKRRRPLRSCLFKGANYELINLKQPWNHKCERVTYLIDRSTNLFHYSVFWHYVINQIPLVNKWSHETGLFSMEKDIKFIVVGCSLTWKWSLKHKRKSALQIVRIGRC